MPRIMQPSFAPARAGLSFAVWASAGVLLLAGCTVYPSHRSPSLAMTTSAEQTQRIFWKDVQAKKWIEVNALLAPNVVWRNGDRVLERAAIVPWLQSLEIRGVTVTEVGIKSNVNDMTLVYALQIAAARAAVPLAPANAGAVGHDCAQDLHAVAVWQQPQPVVTTTGQTAGTPAGKPQPSGYLLTVEDLAADSRATANPPAPCAGQ